MGWLDEHIEDFVKPVVGGQFDQRPSNYFEPEELAVIKNTWRSVKRAAKGQTVLLPGRDVFIFEVLARRENYPTLFVPECSRGTVREIAEQCDYSNYFVFDTGFAGSIPRALRTKNYSLMSYSDLRNNVNVQTFPRLTWSRGLALKIELTPKYWESGRMVGKAVTQPIAQPHQFVRAARLTIEIYTNSAPKFIKKHRPLVPTW